ncbi:MAG: glycine--tRNA ligase subunit beta [Rhodobacteraceae bacterium]|nr:glycine--tRNA ligase subunit beta [Paracoccaceae bacterium]
MPDLLIELFSEEIPARMQARAADDLKKRMTDGLVDAGLTYAGAAAFATPRRLTLTVQGLLARSPDVIEERKGPRVDAPEKAIEGFLRGAGVSRDHLIERQEKKGTVFYARIEKPGRAADAIVAEVLDAVIRNFPWPKSMRWGRGSLRWVRPLQRILCLLTDDSGDHPVALSVDGLEAGQITQGHRFMAPEPFAVTSFEDYETRLKRAHVILSATERAEAIWQDATNQAFALGLEVVEDPGLLAEVAGLVEWPVVLMGSIDDDFLGLPPEVLQTSMKEHQKFFSVRNPKTSRIEKFITVANVETADNGATILAGNQKVLAARLSDAKFFWENDVRVAKGAGLKSWTDRLANVTFHNRLGSQKDRIDRMAALSGDLASVVGAQADEVALAAQVAKADLSSEMVYEFPELQGLMGRYYSEAAGLSAAVAAACQDHYSPLGPSDTVPSAPVSISVALADKLDVLAGFWAIDEKPTGSKDPFALRRAALGVIRLILENDLRLPLNRFIVLQLLRHEMDLHRGAASDPELAALSELALQIADAEEFNAAFQTVVANIKSGGDDVDTEVESKLIPRVVQEVPDLSANLLGFFHDRLKVFLRDQGIRHDVIDACLAMPGSDDFTLLINRAKALTTLLQSDDGENLVQGFKRANNILTQAEEADGVEYSYGADVKFAEHESETLLFAALDAAEAAIAPAMQTEDFATAMGAMAGLRPAVDAFFEAVQVNTDSQVVRRNRLNLLSRIRTICLQVADLRRIEG